MAETKLALPDECFLKARLLNYRDDHGYLHHLRYWKPQRRHRATILFLHGIQSHSGWYPYSCQRLAEAGFEIVFPDRRGSGLNKQDRGHVESVRQLRNDLVDALNCARTQFPLANPTTIPPLFIAGMSWGGRLAWDVIRSYSFWKSRYHLANNFPDSLAGLALLYPGIHTLHQLTTKQRILLSLLGWGWTGSFRRDIPTNSAELFTRTPEFITYFNHNKETLRRATLSFYRISDQLYKTSAIFGQTLEIPLSLMLSQADEIVDNQTTMKWFDSLVAPQKTVKIYSQASHTLEFETQRDEFINDLISWLCSLTM